jgi:hypothetical protein
LSLAAKVRPESRGRAAGGGGSGGAELGRRPGREGGGRRRWDASRGARRGVGGARQGRESEIGFDAWAGSWLGL